VTTNSEAAGRATLSPEAAAALLGAAAPQVTVGVPVYNGAVYLDECLACLARQDHPSMRVVISDNASTDATAAIAAAWAARDPRFLHVRQPHNIGGTANFLWLRDVTPSPYFMWRAYDDLSSDNYVSVLARVLDTDPSLALAVGRVRTLKDRRGRQIERHHRFRRWGGLWRPLSIALALRGAHQSWFYGLWRREALTAVFDRVWAAYPHGWASDHLTLDFMTLEGRIGGDNSATFIQRIVTPPGRTGPVVPAPIDTLVAMRRAYRRVGIEQMASLDFGPLERLLLTLALDQQAGLRVARRGKLWRRRIREALAGGARRRPERTGPERAGQRSVVEADHREVGPPDLLRPPCHHRPGDGGVQPCENPPHRR
jgi:hypothetical protein